MNEDGVAPVVAMMLILAVIVTLVSVYASTYVPSLKDESEIYHLDEVKESFLEFSSHVENSATLKADGTLMSSFPLGGGEMSFNQQKSGGMLLVAEDQEIFSLEISDSDNSASSSIINFSYQTVNNYWKDQALTWRLGFINISENDKTTPLDFGSMENVEEYIRYNSSFPLTLIDIAYTRDDEPVFTAGLFDGYHHNLTGMDITVVNFKTGDKKAMSGNGVGKLKLNSKVKTEMFNSTEFSFKMDNNLPDWFGIPVWSKVNDIFSQIGSIGLDNLDTVTSYAGEASYPAELSVKFTDPVAVTLKRVNVTVSVN